MSNLAGKLLISTPELLMDHIFNQSVILLSESEQQENENMGFIINKPLPIRLHDVFKDIPLNIQIWNGGPVDTSNLFYIHNKPELIKQSILFNKKQQLYLGGDFKLIKQLLIDKVINEHNIKFFLGYTGWGKQQLIDEISEKSWFVSENDLNLLKLNPREVWKKKMIDIDPKNIIWKNAPLNPHLN